MIKVEVKPRHDNRFDIWLSADNGELLLSSNQGYENVEDAERIVHRLFSRVQVTGEQQRVVLTTTYRDGRQHTEQIPMTGPLQEVAYTPPERMFAGTLTAFQDFVHAGAGVTARVDEYPFGPLNKIITLMVGQRRTRSVVWPVNKGDRVTVGRHPGRAWSYGPGWRALTGGTDPVAEQGRLLPGWYVEVNGFRVIEVDDADLWPPVPPAPRVPWSTRACRALVARRRVLLDRIAGRYGYHHDDTCGGGGW